MSVRADLVRMARQGAIEISLVDLLNDMDAVTAVLSSTVPAWLCDELACDGVQIYLEKRGAWILAPLDE